MSYVLSHLSYILILPSPVLFKEKGKWFYVTNAFCCYNSVYLGLCAENCLGALSLWGFVNFCSQTPPSLAKLPQPHIPGSADHPAEDSCRECVWIPEDFDSFLLLFFHYSLIFSPWSDGSAAKTPNFQIPVPITMPVRCLLLVSPLVCEVTFMLLQIRDVPRALAQCECSSQRWGWG